MTLRLRDPQAHTYLPAIPLLQRSIPLKIGRIQLNHAGSRSEPTTAIFDGDRVKIAPSDSSTSIIDLIENNFDAESFDESSPLDQVSFSWLPPIPTPNKIFCIGRNYAEHAKETGAEIPEIPVVFSKFPSALTAHESQVRIPDISNEVDFEAELVVVIGKPGRCIPIENAMDHVFGYCCGNDISARDWQKGKPGGQWLLGKTFDTFAPLGPTIVSKDEIASVDDLNIELILNGKTMQSSNTKHLIFSIDFLISHLSKFCTLLPGDLIFTGTPSGVGAARTPPIFLKPGDELIVRIAGFDDLKNYVAQSDSAVSS